MARPDPFSIPRRPMARGPAVFDVSHRGTAAPGASLFAGERLDPSALHGLLDAAEVMIEGATYGDRFQGTAFFTLELAAVPEAADAAPRLAAALRRDPRARQAIEDHCRRALARLLKAEMPAALEAFPLARAEGTTVRVDVELDAPVVGVRSVAGR
ncbi:MAG: hypothetical protein H6706_17325 [Myxococcales bacterium]|nr:hypothetical protein [Myxococcales bacterium]